VTQLLAAGEVARRLGVSAKTVQRWARDGQIEHVRLGRYLVRFTEEAVDAFLEGKTRKAEARR